MTRKLNLRENKELHLRLLQEAPILKSKSIEYPNWTPGEAWTGSFAKFEALLNAIGAKPYPLPFGKKAVYEVILPEDIINFYEDGTAYSTNLAQEMSYGIEKGYDGIAVYDTKDGKKQIFGSVKRGTNGKPQWVPVAPEDIESTEETWVDYLQLALDAVGLVPGYGDIADIINACISFGRGNTLEGFLSLIGAIPVVGSVISIPLKVIMKGFSKAGDILKSAFKAGKSADEVWIYIKNSGKFGPKEMDQLAKGMGDVASYMSSFRKAADWVLPSSAAKSLDEFSAWLTKNSDEATKIFKTAGKNSDEAAKGILRVRKELDKLGGMEKMFGAGITRRLRNTFTRALGPKELKSLRAAMEIKFFKNMDNPAKLTVLAKTDPNLVKTSMLGMTDDIGNWINTMEKAKDVGKFSPSARATKLVDEYNNILKTYKASPSKLLEQQLIWLQKNNPDLYKKAHANIVDIAQKTNNPIYKSFMNNQINGLDSYFSRDYMNMAGLQGAKERWANLAPIAYNELSDMGEDAIMAAGIETKDDVNGLFWPLLKSALNTVEKIPVAGNIVTGFKSWVVEPTGKLAKYVANDPVLGAYVDQAKNVLDIDTGQMYDPTVKFQIVPDKDVRLKKQELEKEKQIQQNKSFF